MADVQPAQPPAGFLDRVVDGERFRFPEHRLHDFEFWFGTANPFRQPMLPRRDGLVMITEDTGGCGRAALRHRWVPLAAAMEARCDAVPLGPTPEEQARRLVATARSRRGRKPRQL